MLCYVLTAAIVPPGHMAAPLGSGTAFHLCPGDARSAFIIDTLAAAAPGDAGSHQHHAEHNPHGGSPGAHGDHGEHDSGISETSADAGCIFAGVGGAVAGTPSIGGDDQLALGRVVTSQPSVGYRSAGWLRPPVRSPPI
ncbi:MAG: hypothetical protein NWQ45_02970 [Congregibacter sp.]|nr:hypothetical protein [Congregibacter sp.]